MTVAQPPLQNEASTTRMGRFNAFVRHHFTWPGALLLHRAASGLDILRVPINLLLSPKRVLAKITAWICGRLRLSHVADWLLDRRLLLRTAVSSRVAAAILNDLLEVSHPAGSAVPDRAAMAHAVLVAPQFRKMMRCRGNVAEAQATADRIIGAVRDDSGTRSSIAEFTTGLITLAVGAVAFHALTRGMMSTAPGVPEAVSHSTAIADFPLGAPLGGVSYTVFPVGPSTGLINVTVVGLMILGAVVAAFAGVIADPAQVKLGSEIRLSSAV